VAEAIYNCKIPIISAVGHEIDFTIADYVADLRAPTPTGAAEMAVPNYLDIINLINQYKIRLNEGVNNTIKKNQVRLDNITSSFVLKNPMSLYEIKEQKLDNLIDSLNKLIKNKLDNSKTRYSNIISSNVLKEPTNLFIKKQHQFEILLNKVQILNPMSLLDKGYSVVKKDNKTIKDIKDININDEINITLSKGIINAKVIERKDK
jgi:exodeoxyribonuclease VII large subunit